MVHQAVLNNLKQLTNAMYVHNLWSAESPSREALSSNVPFAYGVMPFENWLQFIFIPKMTSLIEAEKDLPRNIALTPMAEHVWSASSTLNPLISIIEEMDCFLNDK